jgi:hypothetical protein
LNATRASNAGERPFGARPPDTHSTVADRPQKITFGEMRDMGIRGALVYCADHKCSHSVALSADQWADDVRLSDIEPRFICVAPAMGCRNTGD